jgi:hypothetical protein
MNTTHLQDDIFNQQVDEVKQMEEKKEKDYVEGVDIRISDIEVKTNRTEPEKVEKVIFSTNKGNISYKPKAIVTEHRKGLSIKRQDQVLIDDLDPKIIEIAEKIVSSAGGVLVKASYHIWNTEKDGEEVTYRFITSKVTLDKWEIINEDAKTEQV